MPLIHHVERHFTSTELVRDIVIGMSDGLTVPFALAAGLSGAVHSTGLVVTAGLAEIAAGSIAMGLGGYLAARGDAEHYSHELQREYLEIREKTAAEEQEVIEIFAEYGVSAAECAPVLAALKRQPDSWVAFMMRFELGLDEPEPRRALTSAVTIAVSYMVGGLIPLAPYMAAASPSAAFPVSVAVTLTALALFGFAKGRATGTPPLRSAVQTALIGGVAAAAAYLIARLFNPPGG